MYSTKQRLIALIACLSVLFITAFMMFVVPHELEHDCCGEECPICACIHLVEQTVHSLSVTITSLISMFSIIVLLYTCIAEFNSGMPSCSLIKEKVRLNN